VYFARILPFQSTRSFAKEAQDDNTSVILNVVKDLTLPIDKILRKKAQDDKPSVILNVVTHSVLRKDLTLSIDKILRKRGSG
jgi:hypothetical protein